MAWANSKTLASGGEDQKVRLWNVNTGKLLDTLEGHEGRVNALAFSPNGKTLASGSGYKEDYFSKLPDKPMRLPDRPMELPSNPEELQKYLDEQNSLVEAWEKDNEESLAAVPLGLMGDRENFDNTIRLWNVSTGEFQHTLGNTGWVAALAFMDGKTLASSGRKDGGLQLWNADTGSRGRKITLSIVEDNRRVMIGAGSKYVEGDRIHRGPLSIINGIIYVQTGGQYTMPDGEVYTGPVQIYPDFTAIALSPNGTRLATAKARVVDSRGSKTYKNVNIKVITNSDGLPYYINVKALVTAMAFSPKGTILASGSVDKTIRLWNAKTGKPRQTLEGHTAGITALAFSKDGTLASGSDDGKVLLWGPNNQ